MTYVKLTNDQLQQLDRLLKPYGFSRHTRPFRSLFKSGVPLWLVTVQKAVHSALSGLTPTQELVLACLAAAASHNGRFNNTKLKWFDRPSYNVKSHWLKFVNWQVLLDCTHTSTRARWHGAVVDVLQATGDM